MQRRTFLQSLTATATLPLLPSKALATITPAAVNTNFDQPYQWARFISRVHNKSSPAMLKRLLNLDTATANHVYNELLANNVITPPNAMGLSQATKPYPQATMLSGPTQPATQHVSVRHHPKRAPKRPNTTAQEENSQIDPDDSQTVNQDLPPLDDESTDTAPPVAAPVKHRQG